jgi:small GTP-binding protein
MEKYVVTMLGEKDHGKSTLIGNLLITTGSTTEARISEVKKATKSKRFEPAHILDSFSEEREQEMTIDTTRAEIVYKKAILELIDVPGHLELIKNMMSGASNSDIAILMVSVKKEEGFRPQTKRHIFLSSMFGIKALVVAINKMDFANYDKNVFEKTKGEIADYLQSINFNKPVVFIPISAYNNENLTSLSKNMPWYKGKPLLETVRDFAGKHSNAAHVKSGVRIFVQDSVDIEGKRTVFGVLYNGKVSVNDTVRVEPQGVLGKIEKLYVKGKKVKSAQEGTNVAITFGKDLKIEKGSVIYGKNDAPHKKGTFAAKMFIIRDLNGKNTKNLTMKISSNNISVKGLKINKVFSPVSGKYSKTSTGQVSANNVVYADVSLEKPYPVERFDNYSELGRFAIYENENFVGVGVVE